ncbi:hypothetical protein QBC40DRAFT_298920 [Triangularia verruculosa]|uniref:Uncharacterized protein n=1 Tax=Triangularia verruculosa TaxID=2587418 RepID=A0AAN7AR09_9PEZI|nr:hypothetical protein QBC40DRAFT_298920 [Triangularia verruculosa]
MWAGQLNPDVAGSSRHPLTLLAGPHLLGNLLRLAISTNGRALSSLRSPAAWVLHSSTQFRFQEMPSAAIRTSSRVGIMQKWMQDIDYESSTCSPVLTDKAGVKTAQDQPSNGPVLARPASTNPRSRLSKTRQSVFRWAKPGTLDPGAQRRSSGVSDNVNTSPIPSVSRHICAHVGRSCLDHWACAALGSCLSVEVFTPPLCLGACCGSQAKAHHTTDFASSQSRVPRGRPLERAIDVATRYLQPYRRY